MRAGSYGAAEFADSGDFTGALQPVERAAEFVIHKPELEAERRWLGMNPVAAADAGRAFVFVRAFRDGRPQRFHVGNENVGALRQLHGKRRVDDVAAGEAEVEPAAGLIVDFFSDGGGEPD